MKTLKKIFKIALLILAAASAVFVLVAITDPETRAFGLFFLIVPVALVLLAFSLKDDVDGVKRKTKKPREKHFHRPRWWHDDYVVVDVETTGLNPHRDKIIELGAVLVRDGEVVRTFSSLINPGRNLPRKITDLTGITNEDLRYAPAASDYVPRFAEFIKGETLLAYNANFDVGFITAAFEAEGLSAKNKVLDVLELARDYIPDMPNYKLATMIEVFDLADVQTHRAADDALATAKLYELIKARFKD